MCVAALRRDKTLDRMSRSLTNPNVEDLVGGSEVSNTGGIRIAISCDVPC